MTNTRKFALGGVLLALVAGAAVGLPALRNRLPVGGAGESGETDAEGAPVRRRIWTAKAAPPEVLNERLRIVETESKRWGLGRHSASTFSPRTQAAVSGSTWVNLGPTDARFEFNGVSYSQVDSGRAAAIAVDPRDPNVVYLATPGGGVWKTFNFVTAAPNPTWHPISDSIGNLAINAMALDPTNPDTLYIGTGDALPCYGCQAVFGNTVFKSTDGGATWGAPVVLAGTYPAQSGGLVVTPLAVRDLRVDPKNSSLVFVATDVGLFRSSNAGQTFSLVDLPNATTQVAESAWSIAYLGQAASGSRWAVSGVYACAPGVLPPWPQTGVAAGATSNMAPYATCTLGNPGDIWISTDSGSTWQSKRASAGALPTIPTGEIGRIALAAGDTSAPTSTVVYAMLADITGVGRSQGVWRSIDGGTTWKNATGVLSNPTNAYGSPSARDCGDTNFAHGQAEYNLAIAVDPTDANRVVLGGNLCGARTLSGLAVTPTWENVAHWFPAAGIGSVTGGALPYVHADWHALLVSTVGGTIRVFAGTDGGIFSSTNVFTSGVAPPQVTWDFHNRGLVTHMCNSLGSGDPANGNPFAVVAGLQDNGARFRDDPLTPTVFDQVIGGDGEGGAINKGTSGEFYWSGNQFQHFYCFPTAAAPCNKAGVWIKAEPQYPAGDGLPFKTRYAIVPWVASGSGVMTMSNRSVWYWDDAQSGGWQALVTVDPSDAPITNVWASQSTVGLLGAVTYAATLVSADNSVSWTISAPLPVPEVSSIAFPPTTPSGYQTGDVYLASSSAWTQPDNKLVPQAVGHLFFTLDRGATWNTLHGNGTGFDLPNVPISVVRYDPGDLTNRTVYVGTDLGVYRSLDQGATWSRYGLGLPMVTVTDMFISKNSSMLRVSTLGRGIWEVYPNDAAAKGVNGDGDFDRNQEIDWVDLGSLAARLGTTPSTSVWPTYTWIADMTPGSTTPPVNAIDDADLGAVLAAFGGRP